MRRFAILAVPGFFHTWLLERLRHLVYASGFEVEHEFVTTAEPHHAFFLAAPATGWKAHITIGNFISDRLTDELSSVGAFCWLIDEALPLAARTLEFNGTCTLPAGLRAVTNSKAAFQYIQPLAESMGIGMARFALRDEADAISCLRIIATALDQDFLSSYCGIEQPFADSFRQTFPGENGVVDKKILAIPDMSPITGDWLDPLDFHFELDASFFVLGDDPTVSVGEYIPVTGPARILFGGPYIFLPAGLVHCQINLELSQDLHNEIFQINVYSGLTQIFSKNFQAPAFKILGLQLNFNNPCYKTPIDIHFLNLEGAIYGEVRLHNTIFRRNSFY